MSEAQHPTYGKIVLPRDGKFRNKKGFLTPYALACGYREAASHPTDKNCWLHMERVAAGFFETRFRFMDGKWVTLYSGPLLREARKVFAQYRRTIVVQQALLKAGVT